MPQGEPRGQRISRQSRARPFDVPRCRCASVAGAARNDSSPSNSEYGERLFSCPARVSGTRAPVGARPPHKGAGPGIGKLRVIHSATPSEALLPMTSDAASRTSGSAFATARAVSAMSNIGRVIVVVAETDQGVGADFRPQATKRGGLGARSRGQLEPPVAGGVDVFGQRGTAPPYVTTGKASPRPFAAVAR